MAFQLQGGLSQSLKPVWAGGKYVTFSPNTRLFVQNHLLQVAVIQSPNVFQAELYFLNTVQKHYNLVCSILLLKIRIQLKYILRSQFKLNLRFKILLQILLFNIVLIVGHHFDSGSLRSELQGLYSDQGDRGKLCELSMFLKDMELDSAMPQLFSLVATI